MVNYVDAIKKPFSDWKKLSIGALMYLLQFLNFLTGFIGRGYTLECAKHHNKKLPVWKKFWQLFVRGVVMVVVGLIYALPFLIVLSVMLGSALAENVTATMSEEAFVAFLESTFVSMGFQIVLLLLLMAFTIYCIPMALMHYMQHYKFGDAFQLNSILQKVFSVKYLITCIVIVAYTFVLSGVAGLLSGLTKITVVLPYVINAYFSIITGITSMTMFGEVYKELK